MIFPHFNNLISKTDGVTKKVVDISIASGPLSGTLIPSVSAYDFSEGIIPNAPNEKTSLQILDSNKFIDETEDFTWECYWKHSGKRTESEDSDDANFMPDKNQVIF